jgi:hypothetical protein
MRHMTAMLQHCLIILMFQHIKETNIGQTGKKETEVNISHLDILVYHIYDLNNLHIVNYS